CSLIFYANSTSLLVVRLFCTAGEDAGLSWRPLPRKTKQANRITFMATKSCASPMLQTYMSKLCLTLKPVRQLRTVAIESSVAGKRGEVHEHRRANRQLWGPKSAAVARKTGKVDAPRCKALAQASVVSPYILSANSKVSRVSQGWPCVRVV